MRMPFVLLFLMFVHFTWAQYVNLDFSDLEINWEEFWWGDETKFVYEHPALRSNSLTVNDLFGLTAKVKGDSSWEWRISIELDFNTSSKNWVEFCLLEDSIVVGDSRRLCFHLGGTEDKISLRYDAVNVSMTLAESARGMAANADLQLLLIRDNKRILSSIQHEGVTHVLSDTLFPIHFKPQYLRYRIQQSTSSFFGKHYLKSVYFGPEIGDTIPPHLTSIEETDSTLTLKFNEVVNWQMARFVLGPDSLTPIHQGKQCTLLLPLELRQQFGGLELLFIEDSTSNRMTDTLILFSSNMTPQIAKGNILINELLFNPLPGMQDFIELYNVGRNPIPLQELDLVRWTPAGRSAPYPLATEERYLYPEELLALSPDSNALCAYYPCGNVRNWKIPSMNNDEGHILLLHGNLVLDSVHYSDDLHISLLQDTEGVSLERITKQQAHSDEHIWHSAAYTSNYASPGLPNTQAQAELEATNFSLGSGIITPNGDGLDDFLVLNYHFNGPSYFLNAYIFSLSGHLVDHPWVHLSAGINGPLKYDLINNEGTLLNSGDYILYIQAYDTSGQVLRTKLPFSVVSQY